jgi:hypothetical protein
MSVSFSFLIVIFLRQDESVHSGELQPKWTPVKLTDKSSHAKHRPMVAGGGKNLPLAILRCLTDWLSVLDARATMNGGSLN